MILKKVLQNTKETQDYLKTLDKVYLVGLWAKYGYREYYFTGHFDKQYEPLVYDYCDFNGECDEWHLMPLCQTTSGGKVCYVFDEKQAHTIANALNNLREQ